MPKIYFSKRFKKSFKKIPKEIEKDFSIKVSILRKDAFASSLKTHKLKGRLKVYYAICLKGGFRVLIDFVNNNEILLVCSIRNLTSICHIER